MNKTSNDESRANEVQIQRNLKDTSETILRTYPQEIFPKRSKKLENPREDQEGLGFSLDLKKLQFVRTRDSRGLGTRLEARESLQRALQTVAIMCTKNKMKIHHKRAQEGRDWIDSKAQRAQGG